MESNRKPRARNNGLSSPTSGAASLRSPKLVSSGHPIPEISELSLVSEQPHKALHSDSVGFKRSVSAPSTPKLSASSAVHGHVLLNHANNGSVGVLNSPRRMSPRKIAGGGPVTAALVETSSLLNRSSKIKSKYFDEESVRTVSRHAFHAADDANSGSMLRAQSHWTAVVEQYIPLLGWIDKYSWSKFWGDAVAGVSLASFQIPLSLSYAASLAHVPTVCGLYGLVVPPIVYCLFGTVPQMIVGPEGAISLVVGSVVEPILKHEGDILASDLVVVVSAVSGGSLLGAGLLKFGYLESVLNGALLNGFISAVGVVMIINSAIEELQLSKAYNDLEGHEHSPLAKVRFLVRNFAKAHVPTVILSLVTFSVIYGLRIAKKKSASRHKKFSVFFPEILFTVVATSICSWYFSFESEYNISVLGTVTTKNFQWKNPVSVMTRLHPLSFFRMLVSSGYVTAILGFFESTTASKSLGALFDLDISADKELYALGLANLCGSLCGALPSFGGYGRSKINALSGAQTAISGAIMGLVTLLMITCMLPSIYFIPNCLLSVISTVIGFSLLEEAPSNILFHWRSQGFEELATFGITVVATIFSSVELGITVGCGYSLLRVIKHSGKSRIEISNLGIGSLDVLVVKIPEPLTFTNAEDLRSRLMKASSQCPNPIAVIIIDVDNMSSIDSSAAQILQRTMQRYIKRGVMVWVCGHLLNNGSLVSRRIKLIGEVCYATSIEDALEAVNEMELAGSECVDEMSLYSRGYIQFE